MKAKCKDNRCPIDRRRVYEVLDERIVRRMGYQRKEILVEVKGKERWIEKKYFNLIKE